MKTAHVVLLVVFISVISSAVTSFISNQPRTEESLIREFYDVENAVHVSPHGVRKDMSKGAGNYILVDLRSQEEYETEHIRGAVSIPAYRDKDTSDYGAVERIVNSFKALVDGNHGKDIIVYCYSMPCMTGRKVGKILSDNGIYVKHLEVGWNEWRYYWNLWNHPHEWNETDVMDYVVSGSEPGEPIVGASLGSCSADSELDC